MDASGTNNNFYLRFLQPLKPFDGIEDDRNPRKAEDWFTELKRLKDIGNMPDKVILAIAASNMLKNAQLWWRSIENTTSEWTRFEEKFHQRFVRNKIAESWTKIKEMKQPLEQSVGEFLAELEELFSIVGLTDDSSKIAFLIASVAPSIAYELEQKRDSFESYEDAISQAIEFEKLQKKYAQVYSKQQ
ncbi:hypothetical protein BDF20DRAFT_936246 [Mycotypha africana]|uniref:uncharacterized protein n=1 Tax=Mycotypha africana TaxID=64632 RepID=UPI0023014025|nr:uncharacterized protein BDF20DRAFT_936246 [Mycotypha africana]KAI8966894.1 hypothetical protein BDF20DRAFT_936246 [Mycotypha africana]